MKLRRLAVILSITLIFSGCLQLNKTKTSAPASAENRTSRELINSATIKVVFALEQYEVGDYEQAQKFFSEALAELNECDVPDSLKTLELLELNLPPEYREKYSLETVFSEAKGKHPEEEGAGLKAGLEIPSAAKSDAKKTAAGVKINDDDFIKQEILKLINTFGEDRPNAEEIENLMINVKEAINMYQTDKRDVFVRSVIRGQKYYPMIHEIFAQKKVPVELANMALVESAFYYRAHSRARARGIWQFVASTARLYGLQVDYNVDDRLDPVKSTIAAREYLLDLIGIFGSRSFLLALAAYNAGEGKVQSCLRRLENPFEQRTFWHINECLRLETRNYIPRILAVTIIQKDLKRFGFTEIEFPKADIFIVPSPVSIKEIALVCGVNPEAIYNLNIDLSTSYLRTPTTNYILNVPPGSLPKLQAKYNQVDLAKVTLTPTTRSAPGHTVVHRVRRGDTLSGIARKYRVYVSQLKKWNGLGSDLIRVGQKLVIYPKGHPSSGDTTASTSPTPPSAKDNKIVYTVKKGNSLSTIAEIFSVSFRSIMKWNGLRRGRIYPGQKLAIYPQKPFETVVHKVTSGENAFSVAQKYNVSLKTVITANGLDAQANINEGQKLIIYRSE